MEGLKEEVQQLKHLLRQLKATPCQVASDTGPEQVPQPAPGPMTGPLHASASAPGQWLDSLAAQQERCAAAGMGQAACRFLAEARSHLCVTEIMQGQGALEQQTLLGGSPLHAMAAFILGPLMHAQQSQLQAALAADACSFVCQAADAQGREKGVRRALQHLISGAGMRMRAYLRPCI